MIQALIEITVDPDFGFAKALRIVYSCIGKKLYGDSERRYIRIVITSNLENSIKCLFNIKGFFNIDLRLILDLSSYSTIILKTLNVKPILQKLSKRYIGFLKFEDNLYLIEKTSKNNKIIIKMLKTKNFPAVIEPSMYLIYGCNEIIDEVITRLKILKKVENKILEIFEMRKTNSDSKNF